MKYLLLLAAISLLGCNNGRARGHINRMDSYTTHHRVIMDKLRDIEIKLHEECK